MHIQTGYLATEGLLRGSDSDYGNLDSTTEWRYS